MGKLGAHRRIDVGIATGHPVSGLLGDDGEAAHEGAANAEDMDMHLKFDALWGR